MLRACAYQGHCDAASLQDYLYYYGSTPHDSQLVAQYQSVLRSALQTGDWSRITIVHRAPAGGGTG